MASNAAELALILKARNLASRETDDLARSLKGVDSAAQKSSGKLGAFAKVTGVAVVGAVAGVVAVLGKAAQMAVEEQASTDRLTAALKANDKAWTGNLDIVTKAEDAAAKLAFTDDAVRDSLTFLVTKTKDTTEAIALQGTAMDLARLKGIDLTAASEMLTKGLDGNSKILKQLGVDLPATATEQERLAAIQAAAAGQAEAYGKTAAGAQERFQIAVDNLMEDLGAAFLPLLTDLANFLTDTVVPAIRKVIDGIRNWLDDNKPLVDAIKNFVGNVLSALVTVLGAVVDGLAAVIDWFTSNKTLMRGIELAFQNIGRAIDNVVAGLKLIIHFAGLAADALSTAFRNATTVPRAKQGQFDLNDLPGSAAGGWVGLHGPEVRMLGERGPEYVIPNHALGGGLGQPVVLSVQMDGSEVARVVDERLFYRNRTAAGGARV